MTNWGKMINGDGLATVAKERKNEYRLAKVNASDVYLYQSMGFEIVLVQKSGKTTLRKRKSFSEVFENEVWLDFFQMGFKELNEDNTFEIDLGGNKKQLDVVAVDDETIIVVECKATETFDKSATFKKELESIEGYMNSVRVKLLEKYPNRKVKFIFATKNYRMDLDSADMERINRLGLSYFSYDTVLYYRDLSNHLGKAARYQLLGNIFQKTKIHGLENRVPALEGKMGGFNYYTFLIEPERLLKVAYVLHRNKANIANFPTYQRLIKKERLNKVREFVQNGGFFPNSLICSIDGEVKFEASGQKIPGSLSRTGILHLPQTYMSMFVIDGQHRLYGYSETKYSNTNVIPVVSFLNLPKDEQVKMFMDINENQKSVQKSLRNTLNADLLWDSANPKKRQESLMIKIAEALGEDKDSPWYARIRTGEESETVTRCITTEAIKSAIKDSSFLSKYDKNGVKSQGTFDKGSNDATYTFLIKFLKGGLQIIKEKNSTEWGKGSLGNLTINNTSYALVRILSDIADIILNKQRVSVAHDSILEDCMEMIGEFAESISKLSKDSYDKLRKYGEGGKKQAWRILQVNFNSFSVEFTNVDIVDYIESISTKNNEEASISMQLLLQYFRKSFKSEINQRGDILTLLGESVSKKMNNYEFECKFDQIKTGIHAEIDPWGCIAFDEIIQIIKLGNNWSEFAQKVLTSNEYKKSKSDTIDWLNVLSVSFKKIRDNKPITQNDFDRIEELRGVFIGESSETSN